MTTKRATCRLAITVASFACATVAFSGASRAEYGQAATETEGDYRIGPGDGLQIIVWRNEDLSMPVLVRPDGWISLPLLNDVKAEGLTPGELQKRLTERLEEHVSAPLLSVIVTATASQKISVLGRVRTPGRYDLLGPTNVLEALALAGGPDDFANTSGIYVLRPTNDGVERIDFDYAAATRAEQPSAGPRLRARDLVFVP